MRKLNFFLSLFSSVTFRVPITVLMGNILINSSLSIFLKRCLTCHPSFLICFKNDRKTLFSVFMRNLFSPHLHKHLTAVSNAASNFVNINTQCQLGNINKSNIQLHRDEINCHKGCRLAAFDRGVTRAKKNQEAEREKNEHCVPSNSISKKIVFYSLQLQK